MADRTAEFRALVASLPKPPPGMQPPPPPPRRSSALPPPAPLAAPPSSSSSASSKASETARFLASFHGNAAVISKAIQETSQKLSHMARLVQRKGLFDDPAEEINHLMYAIKEDIQGLNTLVEATQRSVDDFKHRSGTQAQQLTSHSQHVVGTLRTGLADATKTFKTLLQQRSSNVKEQFDRRGKYGVRTSENALVLGKPTVYRPMRMPPPPSSSSSFSSSSSSSPSPSTSSSSSSSSFALPRPASVQDAAGGGGGGMYGGQQQQQQQLGGFWQVTQQQQQQLLIPEQQYLEARAQAIEDVESHIVELGSIFNRLANMISEQRELVERIEDNVDEAHESVIRTRDYLLGVYSRLSNNGPLVLKSFLVLISFVIMFVLFIA